MKEKVFTQLGFNKEIVTKEESGGKSGYYYYSIDIGDLTLLSCANDELDKGEWYCKILAYNSIVIKSEKHLVSLIETLKSCLVIKKKN